MNLDDHPEAGSQIWLGDFLRVQRRLGLAPEAAAEALRMLGFEVGDGLPQVDLAHGAAAAAAPLPPPGAGPSRRCPRRRPMSHPNPSRRPPSACKAGSTP